MILKPFIKSRVEHTIDFYSSQDLQSRGYLGLKDIFLNKFGSMGFDELKKVTPNLSICSFKNIAPISLNEMEMKMVESLVDLDTYTEFDIQMMVQYLVNCEILPAGDFIVNLKSK